MSYLRIVLMHNSYRSDSPSGEQRVVDDDISMLRSAGVSVDEYFRESDEIAAFSKLRKLELPVRPIWSVEDTRRFRRQLQASRPDLVHVHNLYPLISPGVIRVANSLDIPVVQTVHNYRHVCASGNFFRDGHVCTECAGHAIGWPSVAHGCYRGSRTQSVVMAASLRAHAATWQLVRLFLPVTQFMAEHLASSGIREDRIRVRPNFAPDPGEPKPLGSSLLFVGRLTEEKGLRRLLSEWAESDHPAFDQLRIVGDGPLRSVVEEAAERQADVSYLGLMPREAVHQAMAQAAAVVVPSLWFEGFPITIAEAFSHGRPVITTDLGSLGSVVDDAVGWKFADAPHQLRAVLDSIRRDQLPSRGQEARTRYVAQYSPTIALENLLDAYRSVLTGAES